MFSALRDRLRTLGPGLVLAAAGIGAGDVVVASVTGIKFGLTLLWAVAFTVALKFVLTEALARWQLATGETVVRAWVTRLPRWITVGFGAYLLFWTFMVGASLSSACGLAGASVFPVFSVPVWGGLHAIAAAVLVATNRYTQFQRVMKALVALMAGSVLVCAMIAAPPLVEVARGLIVPTLPASGGGRQVLALLGGIGGSLTVVCYAYWMRGAGWRGAGKLATVRGDVRLAYVFTGLFGIALIAIAAGVEAQGASGARIAIEIAARLETVGGPIARWVFLIGFWCTVFTAMLGVWQGVPQIYVDLIEAWRERPKNAGGVPSTAVELGGVSRRIRRERRSEPRYFLRLLRFLRETIGLDSMEVGGTPPTSISARNDRRTYLAALAYLAGPPLILLWFREPVAVVVTFSIAGAFFMPFLAATLLYLNNRRDWIGALANRWLGNTALIVCLVAFGAVCISEAWRLLR